jgi:hypothetical protein
MKKIFIALLSLVFINQLIAQETKTVVNDANAILRSVGDFTGIKVSGGVGVYLSQGNENAVAISCSDEKNIDKVVTEVKNGILHIYVEKTPSNNWNWKSYSIKAYITIKQLEKIYASGASVIKLVETFNVNNLKIDLSGASALKGDIKANSFTLDASGASAITLTGKSTTANFDLSGASVVKALEFEIDNCKVDATGASSISINVSKQLDAEASGASSIRYKGEATTKNINSSGASSIRRKD